MWWIRHTLFRLAYDRKLHSDLSFFQFLLIPLGLLLAIPVAFFGWTFFIFVPFVALIAVFVAYSIFVLRLNRNAINTPFEAYAEYAKMSKAPLWHGAILYRLLRDLDRSVDGYRLPPAVNLITRRPRPKRQYSSKLVEHLKKKYDLSLIKEKCDDFGYRVLPFKWRPAEEGERIHAVLPRASLILCFPRSEQPVVYALILLGTPHNIILDISKTARNEALRDILTGKSTPEFAALQSEHGIDSELLKAMM